MTAPAAPTWLAPSAPGQLSTDRGTSLDPAGDSIGLQFRSYAPVSLMRMQAFRTGVGGNASTPQTAWDSGWVGGSPAVQTLPANRQACGGNSSVVYNPGTGYRLYFMPSDGTIMSAPVSSAAVGTWRYENPLPAGSSGTAPKAYSMTRVGNRLYCTASITGYLTTAATLYMATVNPDGTLGTWTTASSLAGFGYVDGVWKQTGILGGWDGVSATGWIIAWNTTLNSGQLELYTVSLIDGTVLSATATTKAPTVLRDNLGSGFVGVIASTGAASLAIIGGTASAASAVVDAIAITTSTGVVTGSFAAQEALPAARTGGTLITLQDGSVFYMGGSSGTTAALATATVYYNTWAGINNGGTAPNWATAASPLPSALWQAGGGIAMPDYDLLGASSRLPDSGTATFTGGTLVASSDVIALASFRAATTIALKASGLGAFTTGSNTTVTPTFGSATVTGNLLVAWVSGSDQTIGGNTNLGETGSATTLNYAGGNAAGFPNELATSANFTVPAGGIYVNKISVYMGGHTNSCNVKFCVWNSAGTLLLNSAQFSASAGMSLKTASIASVFIAGGTSIKIGYWRDVNDGTGTEWGTASGSGNFIYKDRQSAPGSMSGATSGGSPFVAGHLQAYITYSTLVTAAITCATAGWLKAVDAPNNESEVQIWYKPNCGTFEGTPTFNSSNGTSPMHAQVAEFTGATITATLDSSGTFAQGAVSTSMVVTNAAGDLAAGDLILMAARWRTTAAGTFTGSSILNNATSVRAGDNQASSVDRHSAFDYGIVASAAAVGTRSPYLVVIGGQNIAGAGQVTVYAASIDLTVSPHTILAWSSISGVGTEATVANLGDGAVTTPNLDAYGSVDVTVMYGAAGTLVGVLSGTLPIGGFNDGDQVTVFVQVVGVDGDPSPVSSTVFNVGQLPQLADLSPDPSITTGQPQAAFRYVRGTGGADQASWQIKVYDGQDPVFDSGVRRDRANSVQINPAPLLLNGKSYSFTWQAWSNDKLFDGTPATAVTTVAVTPTLTPPSAPSLPTATVDSVSGLINLAWLNGSPPTTPGARVYCRVAAPADNGFEIQGAGGAASWGFVPTGTGVGSFDSANGDTGAYALKLTNPTAGNFVGVYSKQGIRVEAGDVLYVSARIKAAAGGLTGPVRIVWANPGTVVSVDGVASGLISSQTGASNTNAAGGNTDISPTVTTSYQWYTKRVVVPAGFGWAFLEIYSNGDHVATPVYFDDVGMYGWHCISDMAGAQVAFKALDRLALKTKYEFAMTQLDLEAQSESAFSVISSGTITPAVGTNVFLHIAGNTMPSVGLRMRGGPTIAGIVGSSFVERFGESAPGVSYSLVDYHDLSFEVYLASAAQLQALQMILSAAKAGNPIFYRDTSGIVMFCGLDPSQQYTIALKLNRFVQLKLRQIPNNLQPNVSLGSALGFDALVAGSIPALIVSEVPV